MSYPTQRPGIQPLSDDNQRALAVIEDLHRFCHHFRIGIQARENPLRIAIVEPKGPPMPKGWKHDKQVTPVRRELVSVWEEITNGQCLHGQSFMPGKLKSEDLRAAEVLDAITQCLRRFSSSLIPMPIDGEPMIILCEEMGNGQRRAYGVIAELDCYGYKDRPVRSERIQ